MQRNPQSVSTNCVDLQRDDESEYPSRLFQSVDMIKLHSDRRQRRSCDANPFLTRTPCDDTPRPVSRCMRHALRPPLYTRERALRRLKFALHWMWRCVSTDENQRTRRRRVNKIHRTRRVTQRAPSPTGHPGARLIGWVGDAAATLWFVLGPMVAGTHPTAEQWWQGHTPQRTQCEPGESG